MQNFKKTLDQYIDARMPIIFVDTSEDEDRLYNEVRHLEK